MPTILQYTPGSQVTIFLQILNDNGIREDGYSTPVVEKIILPSLAESSLYPLDMVHLDTGLYYHRFTLPTGSSAVGSYLVDLSYTDASNNSKQDFVQIICASQGGSFSVSPS